MPPTIVLSDPPTAPAALTVPSVTAVRSPEPETPTVVPEPGGTGPSIQAEYDQSDGCSTAATVSGDLHGDPRATGHVLWVVAVLDAAPNVLYYPKMQVPAPDGRFTVMIDLNTTSGNRRGRFGPVVSPTDKARGDLPRSLDADIAKNDSAYPDQQGRACTSGTSSWRRRRSWPSAADRTPEPTS